MAKRIKIGEPVNDAESWGFDLLEQQLPGDYLLVTNVELPTSTGQLLEIDAIVFGGKAIYLVDIKGYSGSLLVDPNVWLLDQRQIDNPLSKANQIARIYAGRMRENLLRDEHAPWCQGMVFVTGHRGESLSLKKSQDTLSVFGPHDIIRGLTDELYLTAPRKYAISSAQRKKALDVLGRLGKIPDGPAEVAGFNRIRRLSSEEGIEVWEATSHQGELRSDWLLKEVDITSGDAPAQLAVEFLKSEYIRYQQLHGIPGMASCAPLISDGERLLLPVRMPLGTPLNEIKPGSLDRVATFTALRTLISAVEQFQSRDLGNVVPASENVYIDELGGVTLLASGDYADSTATAIDALEFIWGRLKDSIQSEAIASWFKDIDASLDLNELRFLIASEISGKTAVASEKSIIGQGEVLLGRYKLDVQLADMTTVETWKALHEAGKFPLVCTIVKNATERWGGAQRRLAMLMQNFHPSVERIFDIEYLPDDDIYLVNRAWVDADPLDTVEEPATAVQVLAKALTALSYLHSLDILHRRICPDHILVQEDHPILISLSALPRDELLDSMPGYVHASVAEEGWSPRADLWALVRSFTDTLGALIEKSDPRAYEKLSAFIEDPDTIPHGLDYLSYFGLNPKEAVTEIPMAISDAWGISKGYMTFLVLDMINDNQPRSRNQIVLTALRSRHIAGNKTNRSSMNATVSRLKSAGIAEDHGKKVRLTDQFLVAWTEQADGF